MSDPEKDLIISGTVFDPETMKSANHDFDLEIIAPNTTNDSPILVIDATIDVNSLRRIVPNQYDHSPPIINTFGNFLGVDFEYIGVDTFGASSPYFNSATQFLAASMAGRGVEVMRLVDPSADLFDKGVISLPLLNDFNDLFNSRLNIPTPAVTDSHYSESRYGHGALSLHKPEPKPRKKKPTVKKKRRTANKAARKARKN